MLQKKVIDLKGSNKRKRHIIFPYIEHMAIARGCVAHVGKKYATIFGLAEDVRRCYRLIVDEMYYLDESDDKRYRAKLLPMDIPIYDENRQKAAEVAKQLMLDGINLSVINTGDVEERKEQETELETGYSFEWETYFNVSMDSITLEGLKRIYREKIKILHPDNLGGSAEAAAKCNAMYEKAKKHFENA